MRTDSVSSLVALLRDRKAVVLTGAGVSTESGIPDYRGPDGRLRHRLPMRYQEFVRDPEARARYWARSAVGWPRVSAARPNAGHRALARLEAAGRVVGVITQNVDGLHQAGGSCRVTELHGSLARVRCLNCGEREARSEVQKRLPMGGSEGPGGLEVPADAGLVAPDGDAGPAPGQPSSVRAPECRACGGVLKPDIVFFGENVPRRWLEEAWHRFAQGECLLVVGSSLEVYSGRRFVNRAREQGVPVIIINLGQTRGDEAAHLKVEGPSGRILPRVAAELGAGER